MQHKQGSASLELDVTVFKVIRSIFSKAAFTIQTSRYLFLLIRNIMFFLIQKAIMLLSSLYLNHELRKQIMSSSKALEVIQKQQL